MAVQRKEYVTPDEFRETRARVTSYWLESRIAEHPDACCTMGVALLDKGCEAHAKKVAAGKNKEAA